MSFGFSVGDFIALTQLASKVVSGARSACGAHDELTREVTSLEIVLRLLEREVAKPNSILKSDNAERKHELATLVEHCDKVLKVLNNILEKYNGLSEEKRRTTKFWKKVKFGNGEMQDLSKIRLELATHTNVLTMFLNLSGVGSLGKVEEHMVSHGEELRAVRRSVNWVTASMQASAGRNEGSVLTSYANDDKAFWREFRRELVKDGYSSNVWRKHKTLIKDYVKELGSRGALDELPVDNAEDAINIGALNNLNIESEDVKSGERLSTISEQAGESTPICTPASQDTRSEESDSDGASVDLGRSNTASLDLESTHDQRAADFDGNYTPAGFDFNSGFGGRVTSFHFSTKGGGDGSFSFKDPESIFSEFLKGQPAMSSTNSTREDSNQARAHQSYVEDGSDEDAHEEERPAKGKSPDIGEEIKIRNPEEQAAKSYTETHLATGTRPNRAASSERYRTVSPVPLDNSENLTRSSHFSTEAAFPEQGHKGASSTINSGSHFGQPHLPDGTTKTPEPNVSDVPGGSGRPFHYDFGPSGVQDAGFGFSKPEAIFAEFLRGKADTEVEYEGKGKQARTESPTHLSQPGRPEGATKSPGTVFIGNPDGSWNRVFIPAQESNSSGYQSAPERSRNSPKQTSAEGSEGEMDFPPHEQSETEFWVCPRGLEEALWFVHRHLATRKYHFHDARDEVIHNGKVFVVPADKDDFYVGPGLPKFAYDEDGNRVAVTGTPPDLVVQGRVAHPVEPYTPTPRRRPESPVFRHPSPRGSVSPRYTSSGQYATKRPPSPTTRPIRGLGPAEREFARAYIETARTARSGFGPDEPTPLTNLRSIPVRQRATLADARKYRIPSDYSLKNWDPSNEPIFLFGSVMDADSLGKWIYDWAVYYHGATATISDTAGELWVLLIELTFSINQAEDCMPRIRMAENREIVEGFIESGERLFNKLKMLIRSCEDPKIDKAKKTRHGDFKDPSEGRRAVQSFIEMMLSSDQDHSKQADKWMNSAQLFLERFDANCIEILQHPGKGPEEIYA